MTVKQAIAIVIYSLMCIGLSLLIVKCSDSEAQKDIQTAQAEAHDAQVALAAVRAENAALREYSRRADEAVLRATSAIMAALGEHDERVQSIDNSDPEWLSCELPDGVRDAFAGYVCGADTPTDGASDAMH
jgi:hypothetical protein